MPLARLWAVSRAPPGCSCHTKLHFLWASMRCCMDDICSLSQHNAIRIGTSVWQRFCCRRFSSHQKGTASRLVQLLSASVQPTAYMADITTTRAQGCRVAVHGMGLPRGQQRTAIHTKQTRSKRINDLWGVTWVGTLRLVGDTKPDILWTASRLQSASARLPERRISSWGTCPGYQDCNTLCCALACVATVNLDAEADTLPMF